MAQGYGLKRLPRQALYSHAKLKNNVKSQNLGDWPIKEWIKSGPGAKIIDQFERKSALELIKFEEDLVAKARLMMEGAAGPFPFWPIARPY
jgi:hypothetical protein